MYLLKINYLKNKIDNNQDAITRDIDMDKIDKFISKFPYELTLDQKTSVKEILDFVGFEEYDPEKHENVDIDLTDLKKDTLISLFNMI